jgi:hypothetical protein
MLVHAAPEANHLCTLALRRQRLTVCLVQYVIYDGSIA